MARKRYCCALLYGLGASLVLWMAALAIPCACRIWAVLKCTPIRVIPAKRLVQPGDDASQDRDDTFCLPHFKPKPEVGRFRIATGAEAIPFTLKDTNSDVVSLKDFLGKLPVVIEFGSISCTFCRYQFDPMRDIAVKYEGRIALLFVYSREAHPQFLGMESDDDEFLPDARAQTQQHRRRETAAKDVAATLGNPWTVLIDDYDELSAYRKYIDGFDNPLVVVGTDGKIALTMEWTSASELDPFIGRLLGE
jgi:hypothetical protein